MSAEKPPLIIAPGNYQVVGNPRIIPYVCDNTLSEVTTAGFLNTRVQGQVLPTDLFLIAYDEDISFFTCSIDSSGVITLSINEDIADGSITTAKLNNLAVTEDKLADDAVTTAKILDENVTLAKLAAGITPSHVVKFGGTHSYAGGGTSTAATVTGVAATDKVQATLTGATTLVPFKAVLTTNTITFTFSADPGAGTTIDYEVLRAAS